jgi:tetratricopeptide (TPR) repeat protein
LFTREVQNGPKLITWILKLRGTTRLIAILAALLFAVSALADNRKDCKSPDSERAVKGCSALIKAGTETKKNLAVAYTNRGNAFSKNGEYGQAIADYDKAIELNPKSVEAYDGRGASYSSSGEYERAISDFDKVIALKPKVADTYRSRGFAYAGKGDYDRAIVDYDKAISLDPKSVLSHYGRGLAFAAKGDDDHAIGAYKMAIALDPTQAIGSNELGVAYIKKGDLENAIEAFDKAIAVNAGDANAFGNRGLSYSKKGDYDSSIADLDMAISLDPKMPSPYNHRGFAYYNKGDFDRAIADFDTAISLNPNYGLAHYNRGAAHEKKNQVGKALADYRLAVANMASTENETGVARRRIADIEEKIAAAAKAAAEAELAKKQALANAVPTPTAPPPIRKRVALVIGNSAYAHAEELPDPGNDARAMSQLLEGMGFGVMSGVNLSKAEFEAKIAEFAKAAKTADLSLFFYAGHGLQVAGQNYLVPVDAKVEDKTDIGLELISVDAITDHMGGENKAGILLLDACRNNPFLRSLAQSLGAARAGSFSEGLAAIFGSAPAAPISQGLAAITPDRKGLMISYAAAPGDIAVEDTGPNSPFTAALLKRLPMEGLKLELALEQVKADVIEATNGAQSPWVYSDLPTEVYLNASN